LMARRADVRNIEQRPARELPLQAQRPAFDVRVAKVLVIHKRLSVSDAGRAGRRGNLREPVWQAAAGAGGDDNGIYRVGGIGRRGEDTIADKGLVADLVTGAPDRLPIPEDFSSQARWEGR